MANLNLRSPTSYSGQPGTKYKMGAVRLANDVEAAGGTSTNVAVTPSQLGSVTADILNSPPPIGAGTPNSVDATVYRVQEGANAKQGVATLVAGTVVVANTSVTATSRIQLTPQSLGTVTAPSALAVSARTPGVSFTILASQNTDTSVVAYDMFEVA